MPEEDRNLIREVDRNKLVDKVFNALLGTEIFLFAADLFLNHGKWISSRSLRKVFNITREDSLPNWFSATQAFMIGLLIWALYFSYRKDINKNKRARWGWPILASFFCYLGLDDAAKIHERVGSATARMMELDSLPSYSWQFVLGPIFASIGLYIVWFLYHELKEFQLRKWIFFAFSLYVIAVAMDFIEGMDLEGMTDHTTKHLMKLGEEFLEMLGTTFFLITFLKVYMNRADSISITFK